MPDRIELEWGYIEYGPNEVSIVSTVEDPPGLRLASAFGSGLGKISFNRLRPDGVQEEVALLQGKENGNLGGELRLDLRAPNEDGDGAMKPIFNMYHDRIEFHVPLVGQANQGDTIISGNGRFMCGMQSDGNLVIYDLSTKPWSALWASNTVTP
jgi:hypothetical protein